MTELVMARAATITCGYNDGNDFDRLRHDPLMKVAVGRCPESGEPLASQSTISRLENAPRKSEAARLTAALVDQFCCSVKPGKEEIFDIDDTFSAAHGGQQLAFWNAHEDERGFSPMHIYQVRSGAPVVAILRSARTPKGTEVRTVVKTAIGAEVAHDGLGHLVLGHEPPGVLGHARLEVGPSISKLESWSPVWSAYGHSGWPINRTAEW
jgi:hypothetical protein